MYGRWMSKQSKPNTLSNLILRADKNPVIRVRSEDSQHMAQSLRQACRPKWLSQQVKQSITVLKKCSKQ